MRDWENVLQKARTQDIRLITIGASAGGVDALKKILPYLTKPTKLSVALVLHLPASGPNLLPDLFDDFDFKATEARSGENLKEGYIYIAPPDYHLSVEENMTLSLSSEAPINYSRPSINVLFDSAAYALGPRVLGILLTGANEDGARGMERIQKHGGLTIVQDPSLAEFSTMPESCLHKIKPDLILNIGEICEFLQALCLQTSGRSVK